MPFSCNRPALGAALSLALTAAPALAQSDADFLVGLPTGAATGTEAPPAPEPTPEIKTVAVAGADQAVGTEDAIEISADTALTDGDADLLVGPETVVANMSADVDVMPAEADANVRPAQNLRWRVEANVTASDRRDTVPATPTTSPTAVGRFRAVAEGGFSLGPSTTFRLNAALNARMESGGDFTMDDNVRLDLREAYLLHQAGDFTFQLGRVNIRNGVAQGFAPTDFFRAQNVDQLPTLDPREARQNRLGVAAVQVGYLWSTGAVSLAYAPEITGGSDWLQNKPSWGLHLASTNPKERFLFSYTQELADGFSPQLFAFVDDGKVTGGIAASASIGDRWLVYGEATHGKGLSMIDATFAEARAAGRLAPPIAAVYGDGEGMQSITRAAIGATYTTPGNLVASLEYHYNGAGLDGDGWDRYFDLAESVSGSPGTSAQLAQLGRYGALMQEPASRHSLFARVVQNDLADGKLTLTGIAALSLVDQSGSAQIEAAYEVATDMILSARIGGNFGGARTDFGSRPSRGFASVGLEYHF